MTKSIVKKVKKKVIKPAVEELERVKETAKKQIVGEPVTKEPSSTPSPIEEVMTRKDGKVEEVPPDEAKKIKAQARKRAIQMREEIKKHREERKRKSVSVEPSEVSPKPVISQPGKPKLPESVPTRGLPTVGVHKTPEALRKRR